MVSRTGKSSPRHAPSPGSKKKTLEVIEPPNDLIAKTIDYRKYRPASRWTRKNSSVTSRNNRMGNKLDVQMKTQTCSGQDPIAVLRFLAQAKTACDPNGVSERAAVWCFQLYLPRHAHALLLSRLSGNTKVVAAK